MTSELELGVDEIVSAAVEIMREGGLDAVSMRSVATRLGVTPPPVYARVGNKDALLDAVAERLMVDLVPTLERDEKWEEYARRWTRQMRRKLTDAADSRLFVQVKRPAYLKASQSLIKSMRRDGLSTEMAVRGCRLLMWATVGSVAMVQPTASTKRRRGRIAGSDPAGVTASEVEELFAVQIDYIIEGIRRDSR